MSKSKFDAILGRIREEDMITDQIIGGGSQSSGGGGTVVVGSPLTTKGDLYGYDVADARIPVGADGKYLMADSTQATGLNWNTVSATVVLSVITKTANYTISAADDVILGDATAGSITITLPTAVGIVKSFTVKKVDSSANTVTINTTGGQTIDGSASIVISVQNTSKTVVSDNANWQLI